MTSEHALPTRVWLQGEGRLAAIKGEKTWAEIVSGALAKVGLLSLAPPAVSGTPARWPYSQTCGPPSLSCQRSGAV